MTDEVRKSTVLSPIGWDVENYYTNHFYIMSSYKILLGIDGFYDRNTKLNPKAKYYDQGENEFIFQIRIFLPFIFIGRSWAKTPSGLTIKETEYKFGWHWFTDYTHYIS